MRLNRIGLSLLSGLLLVPLAAFGLGADERDQTLRFGYVANDPGVLAIDADTVVVACPPDPTVPTGESAFLVVNPEFAAEARNRFGARVLANGDWLMKNGAVLTPKFAKFVIDRGDVKAKSFRQLSPILSREVNMALKAVQADCGVLVKGYKCQTTSSCANACFGTTLYANGPAKFSNCVPGAPTDSCFQTSGSVTCTYTNYSGPGCGGTIISSGTQTFPNCQ